MVTWTIIDGDLDYIIDDDLVCIINGDLNCIIIGDLYCIINVVMDCNNDDLDFTIVTWTL